MTPKKLRPGLQKVVDNIRARHAEAERTHEYEARDALYRNFFKEPLPYNGTYIKSPYQHPLFAPLKNAIRYATDDYLSFYPEGGGEVIRLASYCSYSPTKERAFIVLDIPYKDLLIERVIHPYDGVTRRVAVTAPPFKITLHLGGHFAEELYHHLLNEEIYAAYNPSYIFEPFCGGDRWTDLPEPKFWELEIAPLDTVSIEKKVDEWKALYANTCLSN